MKVAKTCEQCGTGFECERHRANKARFCGRLCQSVWQRSQTERREAACASCGDAFSANKDHGVWPRFCSRACWAADKHPVKDAICESCETAYVARFRAREDGYQRYCSQVCAAKAGRSGMERACSNCGRSFYLAAARAAQRPQDSCCSDECAKEYYVGPRNPNYRGGFYTHTQMGERHVRLPRPGYVGAYIGEHRLIASKAIGRLLTRQEFVIRINNDHSDNSPDNLFICASNSECAQRLRGSLPWPKRSNLSSYGSLNRQEVEMVS